MSVQAARQAIGESDASGYQLDPNRHAQNLPPEAGALARILVRDRIRDLMRIFEAADGKAMKSQADYKFYARSSVILYCVSAVIGSLLILPVFEFQNNGGLVTYTLVVQFLALGLAMMATYRVSHSGFFDQWMGHRADAETARIEIFNDVVRAEDEQVREGELPLLRLQLEYFRRYQLDVLIAYYQGRGGQHLRSARRLGSQRAIMGYLTAIVGAPILIVVFRSVFFDDNNLEEWLSDGFGAIGISLSALLSMATNMSLINMDERNASRYRTVYTNLAYLRGMLDAVREAADEGDRSTVHAYFDEVNDLISSEHREWLVLRRETLPPLLQRFNGEVQEQVK